MCICMGVNVSDLRMCLSTTPIGTIKLRIMMHINVIDDNSYINNTLHIINWHCEFTVLDECWHAYIKYKKSPRSRYSCVDGI